MSKAPLVAALFVASTQVACVGCTDDTPFVSKLQNTSNPGGGDAELTTFSPAGCGYTIARVAIEGVAPFNPHKDVVSADPQLRYVRRGLGGDVSPTATSGRADPSTSFSVGWQSDNETLASKIKYGESADKLDLSTTGFSYVVEQQFSVGPPDGIRFHEVHVCGLKPGRTYYYQVGGGAAGKEVWSKTYSLTTGPAAGATDAVKIGFAGDSRDALGRTELPVWRAIAQRYKADGTNIVLFSGDMVLVGANQSMWDVWSKAVGEAGPSVFFALAPGNHENEQIRSFAHMLMPGAATKNAERYSSFDYGPVHVVMLDDYPGIVAKNIDDTGYRDEVLAWLDKDLAKATANRSAVPWIVTFHHHPLYSDTTQVERAAERAQVRLAFQALYDKYKVDLDLTGHDHFYNRFKPVVSGDTEDPKGTIYVVCAGAGAPSYSLKDGNPLTAFKTPYDPDKGEGIYGLATVDASSFKAKMYRMGSTASGSSPADDTVIDEFEIAKK